MSGAIFRNEEGCGVAPLIYDSVIMEAFRDLVQIPPKLKCIFG